MPTNENPPSPPDAISDLTVLLGYLEMAAAGKITVTEEAAAMLLHRTRRLFAGMTEGRPPNSDHLFVEVQPDPGVPAAAHGVRRHSGAA